MRESLAAALLLAGFAACTAAGDGQPDLDEVRAVAEEAYVFAFPILEQYKMFYVQTQDEASGAYEGPPNAISHKKALLGPDYTQIVRPNNDTFYSLVWLDMRAEPVVLSVPAIPLDRYYSWQLIDLYTHNIGYIGSRATGAEAGNYLVAGPAWDGDVPEGIDGVIQAESDLVVALARTEVFGPDDIQTASAIQDEYSVVPLSEFTDQPPPPAGPPIRLAPYSPELARSAGFVGYVNALLPFIQPHPSEAELWQRFAAIGISPDSSFDVDALDPDVRSAMDAGVAAALEKIEAGVADLGRNENGWSLTEGAFGTRAEMQGRYLRRSSAAFFGLWGNDLEEAYYPSADLDAEGDPLDGSKHDYVLEFQAGDLPPARSFWSLSMYKLPEQLFIHNPIDRFTIGDRTGGVAYGEDGSLTVYMQHESPGPERESNWLPGPDGRFSVTLRIYWPEPEALAPLWVPPALKKVER